MKNILLTLLLTTFLIGGCLQEDSTKNEENYCTKTGTDQKLSLPEAKKIALNSECIKEGNLKETSICNQYTGTWWIDLDIQQKGCSPACVINVETKQAEINWRCTGLMQSRCEMKPDAGTCKARFIKYYYNQEEGICKEFVWGGCGGVVPFETLGECKEECETKVSE